MKTRNTDSYLVVIYFAIQKIKDGLHMTSANLLGSINNMTKRLLVYPRIWVVDLLPLDVFNEILGCG